MNLKLVETTSKRPRIKNQVGRYFHVHANIGEPGLLFPTNGSEVIRTSIIKDAKMRWGKLTLTTLNSKYVFKLA